MLLTFYTEKKNLDSKYPLNSIESIKVKTIRETNVIVILSKIKFIELKKRKINPKLKKNQHFLFVPQKKEFQGRVDSE